VTSVAVFVGWFDTVIDSFPCGWWTWLH